MEWEEAFGMELESVTRRSGGPVPRSVRETQLLASERVANGLTPTVPLRLLGTRMMIGQKEVVLLTLAQRTGGYRMVALEPASQLVRELWSASRISRRAASVRHFEAVAQLERRLGGRVLAGQVQAPAAEVARPEFDGQIVGVWANLAARLAHDVAEDGPIGDLAGWVLHQLESGDFKAVVTELLDATRVPFAPLADRAGAWLRVLGYDQVHARLPEGPKHAYGARLQVFDVDVQCS